MWSLFRRSQTANTLSPAAGRVDTKVALEALFEALVANINDQAAHTTFSTQFHDIKQTPTLNQTHLAPLMESLIQFLLEHQPPMVKTTQTQATLQTLIQSHIDPTTLEPALMATLATGPLQLAGILGVGLERLTELYYQDMSQVAARESLDYLIGHIPYQVAPELYSALISEAMPSLKPLLKPLADLGRDELLANLRFIYQYYIEKLMEANKQPSTVKAMQEVYAFISQTYPRELTLTFLDLVPAGWLEQERGNLLGREELLKVLEQLQSEKAKLEAVNVRDEALLTSIGDGVVAVNQAGKVIFINNSALEMLGLAAETITTINWFEAVALVDKEGQPLPKEQRPMLQALHTNQRVMTSDLSFVKANGTALAVAITATPYRINGQMTGAILVFKDMSREREVDRQKTEFISVASHQLRTPLGSMKWNLEMLGKDYYGALPKEAQEVIQQTLAVNQRTIELVNTLLDISRIESGRVQDHVTQVDVLQVLNDTLTELQPLAQAKKVTFDTHLPDTPLSIKIDGDRLREVFENIIANAIKYSHDSGKVSVILKTEAESLLLEVTDEGLGIPEKEQFKVFSRFFRAENALKHEPNGSGFGLFVVKSYIDGWGGKIWFKSPTSPDQKGTTFFIQVPLQVQQPRDGLYLDTREANMQSASPPLIEKTV